MHDEELATLRTKRADLQDEINHLKRQIAEIETQVDELATDETEQTDEFIQTHQQLTEQERKRGRLESQLAELSDEIEELEGLRQEREAAQDELTELTTELEDLRGQIDRLETQLVETLNAMLDDLIDILQYQNIARVWVERKPAADDADDSTFELHIVREDNSGAVYEDTVDTLSESEREVIGLVAALAGYLVHNIDSQVPFILIDSVEMIDAHRLAELLQYMRDKSNVEFLMGALLLKDAQAVEDTDVLSQEITTHTTEFG